MMSYSQWGNELYSGKRSYRIVQRHRVFLGISLAAMLISVLLLGFRGLNPSIEFTGGTQFIVTQSAEPNPQMAEKVLKDAGLTENIRVTNLGNSGVRVQTPSLESAQMQDIRTQLADVYAVPLEDVQTNSVGATWGQDVTKRALQSIVIFVVLVAILMTIYFRSWAMSAAAMLALVNDLVVTVGFFSLTQVEVSPATVIGFLTILGYSLYDTVVVFDKVREVTKNYQDQERYTFAELVNLGVNQTLVRSINTSIVALLPVASILFIGSFALGAGTLTDISLALFVGLIVGAASSIFIASPALSVMEGFRAKSKEHTQRMLERRAARAEDPAAAVAAPTVAPKRPGRRLENAAQPKRKKRR